MPENFEAMELWQSIRTQWRVGMGPVGLDYNVMFTMAERMEIDLSPCMFKKIQALESYTLEEANRHNAERNRQGVDQAQKGSKG